jgi:diguanylate cyclase (GGDEF)-like protein
MNFIKRFAPLGMPLTTVFAFLFFAMNYNHIPDSVRPLIPIFSFLPLGVGLLLSVKFDRSRIFYLLFITIMTLGFLDLDMLIDLNALEEKLFLNIAILLAPLNFLIIALLAERGFVTIFGLSRIFILFFQMGTIYYLIRYQTDSVGPYLDFLLLQESLTSWTNMSDAGLILSFILFFAIGGLAIRSNRTYVLGALAGSLICYVAAIHYQGSEESYLMYGAIGIISILALLEESYKLAYNDELTDLPARRALLAEMSKLGRNYSLAMVDIDHFKKFNDTHGHDVGDEVLKMVSAKLEEVTGGGKAYRYGGEEFTIVFANKDIHESKIHLDVIRERIASSAFVLRAQPNDSRKKGKKQSDKTLYVNVSIGIAGHSKRQEKPMDVLKKADIALYRAKEAGRNRVEKNEN